MEKDKKKNFAFAVPVHYYITFVILRKGINMTCVIFVFSSYKFQFSRKNEQKQLFFRKNKPYLQKTHPNIK